jgi:hypothetical protein
MTECLSGSQILPPPLIHDLRARSSERLFRMTGSPGNRGFGRYVRKHIATVVGREKTPAEKAITVAYLSCFLVDHIVQAERMACQMIEGREMTEVEEHKVWEHHYSHVVSRVLKELPDGDRIGQTLGHLGDYSILPLYAHIFRVHHWRMLNRWLAARGSIASRQILTHISRSLASDRSPHAKARVIVLGASMLADIECWLDHVEWSDAYSHVMTDLYSEIARYPDVLEALV